MIIIRYVLHLVEEMKDTPFILKTGTYGLYLKARKCSVTIYF